MCNPLQEDHDGQRPDDITDPVPPDSGDIERYMGSDHMGSEPITLGTKTNNVLWLGHHNVLPFRMTVHEFARLIGLGFIAPCDGCTAKRRERGRDRTVYHARDDIPSREGGNVPVEYIEDAILNCLELALH